MSTVIEKQYNVNCHSLMLAYFNGMCASGNHEEEWMGKQFPVLKTCPNLLKQCPDVKNASTLYGYFVVIATCNRLQYTSMSSAQKIPKCITQYLKLQYFCGA